MNTPLLCPTKRRRGLAKIKFWLGLVLAWASGSLVIAQTGSVVTVNADHVLVINGRKVFTIGFSPGPPVNSTTPTGKDALQELRDSGALLFRMAQTTDWDSQVVSNQQANLDWAYQHGMFVWLNLREVSKFAAGDTVTESALRNLVGTFRSHPALGLWKNFDEAWWGGVSAFDLQRGYDVIKQEDTNHPVVQTHAPRGTVQDLQPYNVATDILALDIYPVSYPPGINSLLTNKEISMLGDWTQFLSQVANGQKQYWMIEQIAWSGATPPGKTLRFPNFAQERFMAYQAVINGARGLMFFGGNVAATLNPQDAALGWNWTFWNDVLKRVVQQLGDNSLLADALVAPPSVLPIGISGTSFPDVEFCVREAPPYLYILACKREGSTLQVAFNGLPPSAGLGEVLYESPRTVSVTNGAFTDWFGPFDVHAYRFLITNQSPWIISQPQSRTNYAGTTASFSVLASGTGPLTYQWRKGATNLSNGGNISGASSSQLTLTSVSPGDAAGYDVIVTGLGSITSAPPATLTVLIDTNPFPTIVSQPQSRTNYAGTTAIFSVTATSAGPLSYQWRKNGAGLSDGGGVSGATSSVLTLANVSLADAAGYDVIVTSTGSVTSAPPATLTVLVSPLLLYEPFDYPNVGTPVSLNTPANWSFNGSGANDLNLESGSLSYPGLAPSIGNSVTNGGAGLGTRRLFGASVNSGKLYFSALFRINDLGFGVWNGASAQVGALTANDNVSFRLATMVRLNSASGYVIGVQKGGTGVTTTFDGTEYHPGETVLLVGKYDFTTLPNTVSLWINPSSFTFGAASEPTNGFISATTGADGYTIDRFNIRQNTAASVPAAMQWDELRIGTSWADVTLPGPVVTVLTDPAKLANGSFQFEYTNSSGQNSSIYASTNLSDWGSLGTATQISPGRYQFIDSTATNYPRRFYRLRSP